MLLYQLIEDLLFGAMFNFVLFFRNHAFADAGAQRVEGLEFIGDFFSEVVVEFGNGLALMPRIFRV